MKLTSLSVFLIALLPLAVFAAEPTTQKSALPAVGDKAVDFALDTLDGKTIRLSDLNKEGPVVILQLRGWVGYQCPICNRQVGEFITHSKEILATHAHVVMIYPGPPAGLADYAKEFISGKSLPDGFYFVTDPDMKMVNAWNLRWDAPAETAYPSTFVVDTKGIISFAKISHTHGGRASAAEVLKALAEKP